MDTQILNKLVQEGGARHAALTEPWKPYKKILWFISAALTAYRYRSDAGEFTLPLVGLIALTCFLSFSPRFAPPIAGIQLLGRRMLALLMDFLLISVVSFSTVPTPIERLSRTICNASRMA